MSSAEPLICAEQVVLICLVLSIYPAALYTVTRYFGLSQPFTHATINEFLGACLEEVNPNRSCSTDSG